MKHGLAGNQGTGQAYHTGNLSQSEVRNASANNNFYANIGVNAGYSTSKNSNNSHNESAVVTTMKLMNENSSITYNNVNNITYQGTQAQGGTFIYNNVKNIRKEAVELHNSSSSRSSNFGISTGATIGYGYGTQITGNGGSVSANRSNQNTNETIYQNGNFQNVNEVHNNTGTMTLSGFNQEGGKVTGNIGKLVVESRQNTSTTTGRSSGASVRISANGVPSSLNVNGSRTNGSRAFVDNQSTFIVGEGSSLHIETLENTGAVIEKEGNSTFKINNYVGKDIKNHDTMKTTGGSLGISTGKLRITNVGFNQDSRDKQGITRNTVVGDVEITGTEGSPINRDITRANEVTKDTHSSTNINVESQTIEYATNPSKLKEDIGKAKKEISDVTTAINESINDRGDDNRNFFRQLREVRLNETVNNIAGKRLNEAGKSEDVVAAWKDAYRDLGYNLDVRYTTGEDTPEMKNKAGTAYVSKDGVHTIIININAEENSTKAGLIGTLAEEASHIVNGVAGRQIATGTDEKGLESTGRAANAYFKEEYKGSNQNMTYKSDGKIDTSKLGTNVGDRVVLKEKKNNDGTRKIDRDLEELSNHLGEQIVYKELSSDAQKELAKDISADTFDTYGIKLDENGDTILYLKKKGKLPKPKTDLDKEKIAKTLAMRELIEKEYKVYVQSIGDSKKLKDMGGAYVNIPDKNKKNRNKNGIIFLHPQPEFEYSNENGELKKTSTSAANKHEFGHAAEDAYKMNNNILNKNVYFNKNRYFEKEQTIKTTDEEGNIVDKKVKYVYFEDQVKIEKDKNTGKIIYKFFGVPVSEANSIYMENVGRKSQDKRRLYMPDDSEFIIEVQSDKEKENLFKGVK